LKKLKKMGKLLTPAAIAIEPAAAQLTTKITTRKQICKLIAAIIASILLSISAILLLALVRGCNTISSRVADLPKHTPPVYNNTIPTYKAGDVFTVVADTQRTSFFECAIFREVNDDATVKILHQISKARNSSFTVISGDLVYDGSDPEHWRWFDHNIDLANLQSTTLLPVLGNHEYWGDDQKALDNLRQRFPLPSTFYSKVWGSCGLIMLDANIYKRTSFGRTSLPSLTPL